MSNHSPQQTFNQYKIRRLSWTQTGEIYGITIPRKVAEKFKDVKFTITYSHNQLILTSGLDLQQFKKKIKNYNIEEFCE